MDNPPIDFEQKAKLPGGTNADYPYAIKARDLMQNFVFATLSVDPDLIEEMTGANGHLQRRLKIPAPPISDKPFVLGYKDGAIQWFETEACE
jgi:hypothetical protein